MNEAEQTVLARIRTMKAAKIREIARVIGKQPTMVKCILAASRLVR